MGRRKGKAWTLSHSDYYPEAVVCSGMVMDQAVAPGHPLPLSIYTGSGHPIKILLLKNNHEGIQIKQLSPGIHTPVPRDTFPWGGLPSALDPSLTNVSDIPVPFRCCECSVVLQTKLVCVLRKREKSYVSQSPWNRFLRCRVRRKTSASAVLNLWSMGS